MSWKPDKWVCEDCGHSGESWGAPERCPNCQSTNVTTDVASVESPKAEEND